MSETAQEKRQWVGSYRDIQTGDGYLRVVAPDGMVWESAGTINDLPAKDQPICCQQSELLGAVNTRPKMKELVEAAEACVDIAWRGANIPSGVLSPGEKKIAHGDIERLKTAISEVRVSLEGK